MIGKFTKNDEGTMYVYQVLEEHEKETFSPLFSNKRNIHLYKGENYNSFIPDSDPRLKLLWTIRHQFIPKDILEIHEVLTKYPIINRASRESEKYIVTQEVIKEVIKEVVYIPLYTPVKNWILSKFRKTPFYNEDRWPFEDDKLW